MKILSLSKNFAVKNAEEILSLEHNWTEIGDKPWNIDNLLYELPMKWGLSQIALHDKKIVGYLVGSVKDNAAFLNKIVVDKNVRGLGIGKKLIASFLKKCLEKNLQRVTFKVRTDNPAVIFYDCLGFKKLPKIDTTRPDGVESYFYDTIISGVLKTLNC